MKQIHSLDLMSKNSAKNRSYLYLPILREGGKYYYCEMIRSTQRVNIKDVDVDTLIVKREVPRQYYRANKIEIN
ncbi:MAG: hypothetical protein LBQ74_14160 [Prevotella sp.]|jgi:hypothetical protein|nr:hypothetical protein [Prevotella sp.]